MLFVLRPLRGARAAARGPAPRRAAGVRRRGQGRPPADRAGLGPVLRHPGGPTTTPNATEPAAPIGSSWCSRARPGPAALGGRAGRDRRRGPESGRAGARPVTSCVTPASPGCGRPGWRWKRSRPRPGTPRSSRPASICIWPRLAGREYLKAMAILDDMAAELASRDHGCSNIDDRLGIRPDRGAIRGDLGRAARVGLASEPQPGSRVVRRDRAVAGLRSSSGSATSSAILPAFAAVAAWSRWTPATSSGVLEMGCPRTASRPATALSVSPRPP